MLPTPIMERVFDEDKTILVYGSKGSGKTNSVSVLMETLAEELNFRVYTNIPFFSEENVERAIQVGKLPKIKDFIFVQPPPQVVRVNRLSDLLLNVVNSGPYKKVFFLDEGGIHADSSSPMSKGTRTFKQLNRIIRHFETCFVIITPLKNNVPPEVRDLDCDFHLIMRKKSERIRLMDVCKKRVETADTGEDYITFPVRKTFRMPLSKYPTDGKNPMGFEVDIDLKETLDLLADIGDSVDIMHNGEGERAIRDMIGEQRYKETSLSIAAYARKYNLCRNTIYKYMELGYIEGFKRANRTYCTDRAPQFDETS